MKMTAKIWTVFLLANQYTVKNKKCILSMHTYLNTSTPICFKQSIKHR